MTAKLLMPGPEQDGLFPAPPPPPESAPRRGGAGSSPRRPDRPAAGSAGAAPRWYRRPRGPPDPARRPGCGNGRRWPAPAAWGQARPAVARFPHRLSACRAGRRQETAQSRPSRRAACKAREERFLLARPRRGTERDQPVRKPPVRASQRLSFLRTSASESEDRVWRFPGAPHALGGKSEIAKAAARPGRDPGSSRSDADPGAGWARPAASRPPCPQAPEAAVGQAGR